MAVEFISQVHVRDSSDLYPKPGADIDVDYLRRYADALEEAGFDYTLVPYGSKGFSSFGVADALSQITSSIKLIVALRPNIIHPVAAAQALSTLDHLSRGRAVVHIISGGTDAEQARKGPGPVGSSSTSCSARGPSRSSGATPQPTTGWTISSPSCARCTAASRSRAAVPRPRPTGSAGRRPTASACGSSRWPRPPSRSPPSTNRPNSPAAPTSRASG